MKLEKLLKKAKKELNNETEKYAIQRIRESLKNISDCKKTLRRLEKNHKTLLNTKLEDLEDNDFEW